MSLQISANAMRTLERSQQVTANNIANANTRGFIPSDPRTLTTRESGTADATSTPSSQTSSTELLPSGTDLTTETVNMMATQNGYDANAKALATQAEMEGRLINEMV